MASNVVHACGFFGVSVILLSLSVPGCGKEQAPPPGQTPPPAVTTQAPPAGTPTRNASSLQIGMTAEQVRQVMGAPAKTEQEGTRLELKFYTPQGQVEVKLTDDRVTDIEKK